MATFKYTAKRGSNNRGQIAVAAGASEAQSDTISINMDVTAMSRGDALALIEAVKAKIIAEAWPPIA